MPAVWETANDHFRLRGRGHVARFVREPHNRRRAGDIEPFGIRTRRVEGQTENAVDIRREGLPVRDRCAVRRKPQRRHDAGRALRNEKITVRREPQRARALDPRGEARDREACGHTGLCVRRLRHDTRRRRAGPRRAKPRRVIGSDQPGHAGRIGPPVAECGSPRENARERLGKGRTGGEHRGKDEG